MKPSATNLLLPLAALALAHSAQAGVTVKVTVVGDVEYNQINPPPLGDVDPDDPATLSFLLDSADFVDSPSFPTRGYRIDKDSFVLTMGSVQMKLQNPYPAGQTPYFVLRDNDPAVDGFIVSNSFDFPIGVQIDQAGGFGQFSTNFYVTYPGTTLPSLDILDAVGSYDFTGLSVFNWTVDDGPFNPLGLIYAGMTISLPQPATVYCTGKVNSQGCTPSLTPDAGFPSLSSGPWNINASDLINNKLGIFFYGFGSASTPFQGGTLCVAPPVTRTSVQDSAGNSPPDDCSGTMTLDVTATVPSLLVPTVVYVQVWGRDPAASFGSSLSNAVETVVCP